MAKRIYSTGQKLKYNLVIAFIIFLLILVANLALVLIDKAAFLLTF